MSNKMQRYIVYLIWKLLYMFRVVPPPIIRSANNCIYSIWYLSHRYCYLPLSLKSWNWFECAVGGVLHPQHTIAADSNNGLTNTGCCRYSSLLSCWWVAVRPETCRAVSRYNKLCNVASCWIYIRIVLVCWRSETVCNIGMPAIQTQLFVTSNLARNVCGRCFNRHFVSSAQPSVLQQATGSINGLQCAGRTSMSISGRGQ